MFDDDELRRSDTRGRFRNEWLDARFSFAFGAWQPPHRQHFGVLRVINEDLIAPGRGFEMHPHDNLEILMLPLRGRIAHADSLGNVDTVLPGEVLLMSAGAGIQHSQKNPDLDLRDHHLQIWLFAQGHNQPPRIEKRAYATAGPTGRLGRWQCVASPDGAEGSLRIDQDARVYRASVGSAGLAWPATAGRSLYLHLVQGALTLVLPARSAIETLQTGDALALRRAAHLQLQAVADTAELLLLDLPAIPAR